MRSLLSNAKVPDVVGGAVIAAVGAGFALGGVQYGLRTPDGQLDPGAMPFLAGTLLVVFGLGIALSALRPQSTAERPPPAPSDPSPPSSDGAQDADATAQGAAEERSTETGTGERPGGNVDSLPRIFALVVLTAAAIAAITWFDAYITLAVLIFVILTCFERVRLGKAAAVALGVVGASYLIFSILLDVPLPSVF